MTPLRSIMMMVLLSGVLFLGCQEKNYLELGGTLDRTTLIENAVGFETFRSGQESDSLVLTGTIGKVCPAGCWFYLLEDADMVYVDVLGDFEVPQSASGKTAWVQGRINGEGGARILQGTRVLVAPEK